MRLALANVLALVAFIGVMWTCFAFMVGFAMNPMAPLGFTEHLDGVAYAYALLPMSVGAPVALLITMSYFALFRARPLAIAAPVVAAIVLGIAFLSPLPDVLSSRTGAHALREWIMVVWAGVTAAAAHHVVFALFRPRRV